MFLIVPEGLLGFIQDPDLRFKIRSFQSILLMQWRWAFISSSIADKAFTVSSIDDGRSALLEMVWCWAFTSSSVADKAFTSSSLAGSHAEPNQATERTEFVVNVGGPAWGRPGILVALSCAFILKRFEAVPAGLGSGSGDRASRHHTAPFIGTTYEISLVVMSAYLAYLVAEVRTLKPVATAFTVTLLTP